MCGIIGLFNDENAETVLRAGLRTLANRGKDYYGIATVQELKGASQLINLPAGSVEKNALGHCLHSVVSFIPQPLVGKGKFAANCEIYNWQALNQMHGLSAANDAEMVFQLLEKHDPADFDRLIKTLDGDYAVAYWRENRLFLFRDPVGVKPLWYCLENNRFGFASEAKSLYAMGFLHPVEQNPREYIAVDLVTHSIHRHNTPAFILPPSPHWVEKEKTLLEFEKIWLNAVKKRIPCQPFGILFSGGIDSVMLAKACQKLGASPVLFHSTFEDASLGKPSDLAFAQMAAQELALPLYVSTASLPETEELLKILVPLIESSDVIKTGVGLAAFLSCKAAERQGIKVIFSGIGSDELFGGYERSQARPDQIAQETVSYLLKAYEKDLYRDDLISMQNRVELRVPYYDKELIQFALEVADELKVTSNERKVLLRRLARRWGISASLSERPKKASQYGSNADKCIEKLAKKMGFPSKSAYLDSLLSRPNIRLGALISGGKDSWLAATIMQERNYPIACLITLESQNPDSYMFHTPNVSLVQLQAHASGLPLVQQGTIGTKETELEDLKKALVEAQTKYGVEGIVNGALYSEYQRSRIEKICDELGLKIFSPLWHYDQTQELNELLARKFKIIFSSIACQGLDPTWLGKTLDSDAIAELSQLHKKYGINVAGEGGEYESLVLDCPLFVEELVPQQLQSHMQNECTGRLELTASLAPKQL